MGDPNLGIDPSTGKISREAVERSCEQLLSSMPLQSYSLVIRCGSEGCYLAKNGGRSRRPSIVKRRRPANHARGGLTPNTDMESLFAGLLDGDISFEREPMQIDPGLERWFPAYFEEKEQDRVVDPTGGGNGFLGALAVALARGIALEEAACWGSISASLCIEQVGVPVLGANDDGKETWNGDRVDHRLQKFMKRVGVSTEGLLERGFGNSE